MIVALLKELAAAAGKAAAREVVALVTRAVVRKPEPVNELKWRDVEHLRKQERSAIAAAKAQEKR